METSASLSLALLLVACGGRAALTRTAEPPPREPPGAFLDPVPAEPSPTAVAEARGTIALALPLSQVEARALVLAYFRALTAGDASVFGTLVARSAKRVDDEGSFDLVPALVQRMRAVDYSHLAVDQVVSYDDVQMSECTSPPSGCPTGAERGDMLLDISIRVQELGVVKLFGPRVQMVVRRFAAPSGWLIVSLREPGAPWSS